MVDQIVPGLLGARPTAVVEAGPHHSPKFRIDEGAFGTGIALLASLAARLAAPTAQTEDADGLRLCSAPIAEYQMAAGEKQ